MVSWTPKGSTRPIARVHERNLNFFCICWNLDSWVYGSLGIWQECHKPRKIEECRAERCLVFFVSIAHPNQSFRDRM